MKNNLVSLPRWASTEIIRLRMQNIKLKSQRQDLSVLVHKYKGEHEGIAEEATGDPRCSCDLCEQAYALLQKMHHKVPA